MAVNTAIPTPPRLTGDLATDLNALSDYIKTLHTSAVVESGLLDPFKQATPGIFNAKALPAPSDTTIAKAQDVANRAYQLAAKGSAEAEAAQTSADAAQAAADAAQATATEGDALAHALAAGTVAPGKTVTISDADTTATVTFTSAKADANYPVLLTPALYSDGGGSTPPLAAFIPTVSNKTVNGFDIAIGAAPGVGNSVTFLLALTL